MKAKISTTSAANPEPALSLWSAKIPYLGLVAVHHWFVAETEAGVNRWEVWQSTAAGGTSWGHLHLNLMPATHWPHADTPLLHQQWTGTAADTLINRIEHAPHDYPWLNTYRYWPGPNSNTYVQWVLQTDYKLGWRAAGRGYTRFA